MSEAIGGDAGEENRMAIDEKPSALNDTVEPRPVVEEETERRSDDKATKSNEIDWEQRLTNLTKELEAERRKNSELSRNMKYLQADIVNLQRQTDRMLVDVRNQSRTSLVLEIISILEDLDRAIAASSSSNHETVIGGLKMLHSSIEARLRREDVERIKIEKGSKIDPRLHEAVAFREVEGEEDGSILSVISFVYTMGDKVIKPAMVEVARSVARRSQQTASVSEGEKSPTDQ